MNKRKVKGTNKGNPKSNLIDSKDLERNIVLEISKELIKPKKKGD